MQCSPPGLSTPAQREEHAVAPGEELSVHQSEDDTQTAGGPKKWDEVNDFLRLPSFHLEVKTTSAERQQSSFCSADGAFISNVLAALKLGS